MLYLRGTRYVAVFLNVRQLGRTWAEYDDESNPKTKGQGKLYNG